MVLEKEMRVVETRESGQCATGRAAAERVWLATVSNRVMDDLRGPGRRTRGGGWQAWAGPAASPRSRTASRGLADKQPWRAAPA